MALRGLMYIILVGLFLIRRCLRCTRKHIVEIELTLDCSKSVIINIKTNSVGGTLSPTRPEMIKLAMPLQLFRHFGIPW